MQRLEKVRLLMFIYTTKPLELTGRKVMEKSLLKQFEGSDGRRHLIRALTSQPLICDQNLAVVVSRRVKLEAVPVGTKLIHEGASDSDRFLILDRAFLIALHGRFVAHAHACQRVAAISVVGPS